MINVLGLEGNMCHNQAKVFYMIELIYFKLYAAVDIFYLDNIRYFRLFSIFSQSSIVEGIALNTLFFRGYNFVPI